MTAALYILDPAHHRVIPYDPDAKLEHLRQLERDYYNREIEISRMRQELMHDGIMCAMQRRRIRSEIMDIEHGVRK